MIKHHAALLTSTMSGRTKNGADWELVTAEAEWTARPGHQVVVTQDRFVLFGGFGLGFDITVPANPMDLWVSTNGKNWKKASDAPWNAESPADIKYDFDALSVPSIHGGTSILTFGGDRETFDFNDPLNYLNVDNDVWMFTAPKKKNPSTKVKLDQNKPNPVFNNTTISYSIPHKGKVMVVVYDLGGNRIKLLTSKMQPPGEHSCQWNGRDQHGRIVPPGIYVAKLQYGDTTRAIRMIKK